MRMGTVVGRVTLSARHPAFRGERLLLTLPWNSATWAAAHAAGPVSDASETGAETPFDPAIVVYDELGAGVGQRIAISEGREAACPFKEPTPVDAYCAALIDETFYQETQP